MKIESIHSTRQDRPLLIMIPGFFTKPLVQGTPIHDSWSVGVSTICRHSDLNGCVLHWDSGNILDLDLSFSGIYNGGSLESVLTAWRAACERADTCVAQVSEFIKNSDKEVYLMGHSLGGKIALKVAETTPIKCLISLAPAVDIHGIDYDSVSKSVETSPVICHSQRDRVLSTIFTCGQFSLSTLRGVLDVRTRPSQALRSLSEMFDTRALAPALGLVGAPPKHTPDFRNINTLLRHSDYSNNVVNIWRTSQSFNGTP